MSKKKLTFSQRVAKEIQGGRSFFSAIFSSSWNSLGSWINTYDATDPRNQLMRGVLARPTSAADLTTALPYIRNLVRHAERNNATVRAAVEGLTANVVGSCIDIEPDTGNKEWDDKLREQWREYCLDCTIDGKTLAEAETLGFREVVVAGEALGRFIIDEDRAKAGKIPLCLMFLEAEFLGDSGNTVVGQSEGMVGGIELDKYGRASWYNLIGTSGKTERVPASVVLHCYEKRRALQIRGESWFAPVLTTLKQEKDLVACELEAAKNTAGLAVAITTAGGSAWDVDEKGSPTRDISPGSVVELMPGESVESIQNTRPSQQIAPFRDMLRGDEAGALRIGRRWLDRDISKSNYSSSRTDMLDSERLLGPVRAWFGHGFAGRIYKQVLPYLAIKAGIPLPRDRYRLVPDGQPYVDPLKDAQAAAMAISYGLSTFESEIGKRGGDWRQIMTKLAEEKQFIESLGLDLQTPGGLIVGDEAVATDGAPKTGTGDEPTRDKKGHFA